LADVLYLTVVINKINNETKNIVVAENWLSHFGTGVYANGNANGKPLDLGIIKNNSSLNVSFIVTMWPDAGNEYQNLPADFNIRLSSYLDGAVAPTSPPTPVRTLPPSTQKPYENTPKPTGNSATQTPDPKATENAAASNAPTGEPGKAEPSEPPEGLPSEELLIDPESDGSGSTATPRPTPPQYIVDAYPDYVPLPDDVIRQAETAEDFYMLYQNDPLAHGAVDIPFDDWVLLNGIMLPLGVVTSLAMSNMPQTGEPSIYINILAGLTLMAFGARLLLRAGRRSGY
jgi:hypothetical protein